ncbi:hypothetical protein [Bradyrhizobium sp. RT4b]|uniref:hypothetical protein n=1 Tax=unclassified Bradyrhizobium TaxID=2631580 RepID=UPI00339AAAF7
MKFQMTRSIVENRGVNYTFTNVATGRNASTFIPVTELTGTPYDASLKMLDNALLNLGAIVEKNSAEYQPASLMSHNRAAVEFSTVSAAFKSTQRAGLIEADGTRKDWAERTAIEPANFGTAAIRARGVAKFDATPDGQRPTLLSVMREQELAGIMEVGALDDLPPEVAQQARERYASLRGIRVSGIQADHTQRPTDTAPLLSGPDVASAQRAAKASFDQLKQRSENIGFVEKALNEVISVVETCCDLHRPQAYRLLTTGSIDVVE